MTIPYDLFRPFGAASEEDEEQNPFARRTNTYYSKPLKPIKVTAKKPTWQEIKSGKVDAARDKIGARKTPTPQAVADALRARAREAYAEGGLNRTLFKGAVYADLFGAGAGSAIDIGGTGRDVSKTVAQFAAVTDEELTPSETIVPVVAGALTGNIAAFMTGSRAATAAAQGAGRVFGIEKLANAGATMERWRKTGKFLQRATAELAPAVPINIAQGLTDPEGGETTAIAAKWAGFDNVAEQIRARKGRVTGAIENELMDVVGFGVLDGLSAAVKARIVAPRDFVAAGAGAGIGALTDDEDRLRGAGIGAASAFAGSRGGRALGLSTEVVSDLVEAPFKAYSPLLRKINGPNTQAKGDKGYWKAFVTKATRAAEVADTRITEWIDAQPGTITRLDIANAVRERLPKLGNADAGVAKSTAAVGEEGLQATYQRLSDIRDEEIRRHQTLLRSEPTDKEVAESYRLTQEADAAAIVAYDALLAARRTGRDRATRFDGYVIAGENKNYGELVTTVPPNVLKPGATFPSGSGFDWTVKEIKDNKVVVEGGGRTVVRERGNVEQILANRAYAQGDIYRIPQHWGDTDNPILHNRVSERTVNGERALVVHDIQSDAHQAGREQGYRTPETMRAIEEAKARREELVAQKEELMRRAYSEKDRITNEILDEDVEYAKLAREVTEMEDAIYSGAKAMREEIRPTVPAHLRDDPNWIASVARAEFLISPEGTRLERARLERIRLRDRRANVAVALADDAPEVRSVYAEADELNTEISKLAERQNPSRLIPDLPFKKTAQWTELGLKRIIDEAQRRGIDRVVLPTGAQAADMFSLRQVADKLVWRVDGVSKYNDLVIWKDGERNVLTITDGELDAHVGREVAEKLRANGSVEGDEITVGGTGMMAYYDTIVPSAVKDYAKKLGVKIEMERVVDTVDRTAAKAERVKLADDLAKSEKELRELATARGNAKLEVENMVRESRAARYAEEQALRDNIAALRDERARADVSDVANVDAINDRLREANLRLRDFAEGRNYQGPDPERTARIERANRAFYEADMRLKEVQGYRDALRRRLRDLEGESESDPVVGNLSFKLTPELKAAIANGQPLYALGALSMSEGQDDKAKLGSFAALAMGTLSGKRFLRGVNTKALAKVAPEVRRALEQMDPNTGLPNPAYASARAMRETIATVGRNPRALLQKADSYKALAKEVRAGIASGALKEADHAQTLELADRFALGMTILSEAAKKKSSPAMKGAESVAAAAKKAAAAVRAANPRIGAIAAKGTDRQRANAVKAYMAPILKKALLSAMESGDTESKWYDQAIRNMGAMATMVMPELADARVFALFNYATSILSNGNPVTPELNAGLIVMQQYLRTGKFSIYAVDEATGKVTDALRVPVKLDAKQIAKGKEPFSVRPLFAAGDDGDILRGGPKFRSWEASLKKLNAVLARHESLDDAIEELMGRGVTPGGKITAGDSKDRLRSTQLFGPKVGQYGTDKTMWLRATLDNPFPEGVIENATNDLWMARGYNAALGRVRLNGGKLDDSVDGPMHRVLNIVQRELGQEVGEATLGRPLEARNVQALLWEGFKKEWTSLGASEKKGAFDTMEVAMANYLFSKPGTRSIDELTAIGTGALPALRERFVEARAKTSRPMFLTPLDPEELAGKEVFLMHDDKVGYVLDQFGDLQNVFNNGGPRGAGADAVVDGIRNGAKTLDAYDNFLPRLYSKLGFVETGRMKFNPDYAPKGWEQNPELASRPDVVFMAWNGFHTSEDDAISLAKNKDLWEPHERATRYFDDYEEAQRHAREVYAGGAGAAGRDAANGRGRVRRPSRGGDSGVGLPRRGALTPGAAGGIGGGAAGAAAGSLAGASIDASVGEDLSTREGAVAGLLGGLVTGSAGGATIFRKLPGILSARTGGKLLSKSPAVAEVAKTIATGARELQASPSIFGSGIAQQARRAYAAIVDDTYALRQLGRQVAGDRPLEGMDAQLRSSTRSLTWAHQKLRHEFRPVLDAAKGREIDVMVLVKARRDLDLRSQGVAEKTDLSLATLQQAVADASKDQRTVAAADALQAYYKDLLDWKLREGVLSPEAYQEIVASEDFYTPFMREWGIEGVPGSGQQTMGGRVYNEGSGVRKMDRDQKARAKTIDPFEIAVMDTQKTAELVGKQRVFQMVSAMVEANGGEIPGVIKRVPKNAKPDPLARRINAIVAGEQFSYEILDPDIYKAIQSFGPKTQVPALLRAVKEFKRATITSLPDFMIRNLLRDNAQVALGNPVNWRGVGTSVVAGAGLGAGEELYETGDADWAQVALRAMAGAGIGSGAAVLMPQLWRTMRGVTDIMHASDSPLVSMFGGALGGDAKVWNDFLDDGAASFGHYARNTMDARNTVQQLRGDRAPLSAFYNPKRWMDGLNALGSTLENAPRLATYKSALRQNPGDRARAAALAADVSLDFSLKGGSGVQQMLNESNAFFNARIQGWDKVGRLARDPRTWGVGFATLTAPSIGNWIAIHQDDESRESYYEHPSWVRNTFWLVPTGGGEFLYIPKPFELGTIFATVPERFLDWMYQTRVRGDARPGESAMNTARELGSSVVATELPLTDLAKPLVEQAVNYDMFRNRNIVSSETYSSSKTIPERQIDDRTSKIAEMLGERYGWSPQRIDHAIGAYAGSLGKIALRAGDEILPGENTRPTAGRMPIVGDLVAGFTDRKGTTSDDEVTVRRRYDRAQRVENALRPLMKLLDDGQTDPQRRAAIEQQVGLIMERNVDVVGAQGEHLDGLKVANDALSELRDAAREVQRTPGLSIEERKAQLEGLRAARAQVARAAVAGRYDEIAALMESLKAGTP